jgi:hypothetical protein
MTSALDTVVFAVGLVFRYWWVWLPILLVRTTYSQWMDLQKKTYLANMKWVLLEIIPPPDVLRSPNIAELFFSSLHAAYGGGTNWKSQAFGGKIPDWFSFEIASNGGDTHFYIRTPESQRNLVESALFAQYPDAEMRIALEDYINLLPEKFNPEVYDVSGNDFLMAQPPAYPIKSWREFEEKGGKDDNVRIDPLSPLFEMMGGLRQGEHLWLQYVVRPTGGEWVKDGQKVIDKLAGKAEKKEEPPLKFIFDFIDGLLGIAKKPEEKKPEKEFNLQNITPAQKIVLELVELKLAKPAFKTAIRVLYVARKDAFVGTRTAGVSAMFKQLFYNNLNSFKPGANTRDKGTWNWMFPSDKGFNVDARTLGKKEGMYDAYRKRAFSAPPPDPKSFNIILNVEELATLWHLPGLNAKAPLLPRVQAKKGQPPVFLPTR